MVFIANSGADDPRSDKSPNGEGIGVAVVDRENTAWIAAGSDVVERVDDGHLVQCCQFVSTGRIELNRGAGGIGPGVSGGGDDSEKPSGKVR